ncbi:hypothetical protein HYV88_03825 [Candidatus Woesearchaeota archaeon]|nr:hypothetical protein [Candidatus Woesearchaeota archaeon]
MIDEEKIRNSFQRVKEDILRLEAELRQNKEVLTEIKKLVESPTTTKKEEENTESSTGNHGVYSNIQTNEQSNKHLVKPSNLRSNIQANIDFEETEDSQIQDLSKKEPTHSIQNVEKGLLTLTKQEFHLFLLIYQLEEQGTTVNYTLLEGKLSLTSGCLRGYVSSMISKGAPVMKKRLRNNSIILSINPSFRSLTSTQKLINLYYKSIDPSQTHLSNRF